MKVNKITHQINFDKIRSTDEDLLSKSLVLNPKINQKSTAQDVFANFVVFNWKIDQQPENYFFLDDCGNIMTRAGSPVVSSTVTRNGNPVCYFSSYADYFSIPYSFDLDLVSTDYTIEFWCYVTKSSNWIDLIDFRGSNNANTNYVIGMDLTNWRLYLWDGAGGPVYYYSPNNAISQNTWFHYALCSKNNTCTVYVNGQPITSFYWRNTGTHSSGIRIGNNAGGSTSSGHQGYLSDLRITRSCRYESAFTPPNLIPELSLKGPRLYDQILGDIYTGSSGGPLLDLTSGPFGNEAIYFNGTSYLTIPYSKYFDLFDKSCGFTIEFWFKIDKNSIQATSTFRDGAFLSFGWPNSGSFTSGVSIRLIGTTTTTSGFFIEWQSSSIYGCTWAFVSTSKNEWHHFAVCKENNQDLFSFYFNGKKLSTTDSFQNTPFTIANLSPKIGADTYTGYYRGFKGWMSDLRITRECRYFGNFAVPTKAYDSGDPYISDTSLLLHFNDTKKNPYYGLTTDVKNHTVTATSHPGLSTGSPFGTTCAYFEGTAGNRLVVSYSSDLNISFNPFTLEMWYKPNQITAAASILNSQSSENVTGIGISQPTGATNKIQFVVGNSDTTYWEVVLTSITTLVIGQWYHIAVTRDANNYFTLWIDGVAEASSYYGGINYINSSSIYLGSGRGGTNYPLNGYIDDFRFTKDIVRYPSSLKTSPDFFDYLYTKLILNFNGSDNSTTFTDSSLFNQTVSVYGDTKIKTDQYKFGASSGYFDGTGDYLTVPYTQFSMMDDWAFDFWVRPTTSGTNRYILTFRNGSNYATPFGIFLTSTNQVSILVSTSNTSWAVNYTSTTTLSTNNWHHILVQKTLNQVELYINGVLDYRILASIVPTALAYDLKIGYDPGTATYFTGYLDDLRIVDGNIINPLSFTPPSSALTTTAETVFHLHFEGSNNSTTFTDEKGNTVAVYGDTKIKTDQYKFGASSGYFDGASDYLRIPYSGNFNFNNVNFTVECWFYQTYSSGWQALFAKDTGGSNFDISIYVVNGNQLVCYTNGTNKNFTVDIPQVTLNTWTHVALVRSGNSLGFYLNGHLCGTSTMTITNASTSYFTIGCASWNTPNAFFNGYIDEFRIIRGVGIYNTFPVPTQERTLTDPNLSDVTLLIPFNGSNNSTTFTDYKNHSISAFGNAKISTTQYKTGSSSGYFDGSGDYLTIPNSADFAFGSSDFTIDFFMRPEHTGIESGTIIGVWDSTDQKSWKIEMIASGSVKFYWSTDGSAESSVSFPFTYSVNTWFKCQIARTSGTIKCYINSSQIGTDQSVSDSFFASTSALSIAGINPSNPSNFYKGYLDSVRITKNVGRSNSYLATYTIPTSSLPTDSSDPYWTNVKVLMPFDELPDTVELMGHSFVPLGNIESSTQNKYGGRSIRFKGTGYLTCSHSDDLYCPGDFTLEGWIYPESVTGTQIIFRKPNDTVTYPYPAIEIKLNGTSIQLTAYQANAATGAFITNATFGTVSLNTWSHFAIVKTGTIWKAYLDGVAGWTATIGPIPYYTTQPLVIGGDSVNNLYGFTGCMNDLRLTKNVGRYSSNFTPPTELLPEEGEGDELGSWNPGMLIRFNNLKTTLEFFDEKGKTITVSGDATLSSTQFKYGGSSGYFDGTGDYLTISSSSDFAFGTGDFTVEGWFYFTDALTQIVFFDTRSVWNDTGFCIFRYTDGHVSLFTGGLTIVSSTTVLGSGTWYHIAVSRTGNSMTLYINGTLEGTATNSSNITCPSNLLIGKATDSAAYNHKGYMNDIRITKGTGRYTASFTAPTDILPNETDTYWTNTVLLMHMNHTSRQAMDEKGHPLTFVGGFNLSTAQSKWGGTSGYFDGATSFITTPIHSDFLLESGDFSIDCWIYRLRNGTREGICGDRPISGNYGWVWHIQADNTLSFFYTGGSAVASTGTITNDGWHHIAVTRIGNTITHYIDGVNAGSGSVSNGTNSNGTVFIIGDEDAAFNSKFKGYIDDFRLIKGISRFTGNFIPPTGPLPAFSGGQVNQYKAFHIPLTGYSGNTTTFVDKGPANLTLTPTAMTYSSTVARFPNKGYPAYFNGSSSKIATPNLNSIINFQKNFNIECWIYPTVANTDRVIYSIDGAASVHVSHVLYVTSANKLSVYFAKGSAPTSNTGMVLTSTATIATNTWTHIRVYKENLYVGFFINGVFDSGIVLAEQPKAPVANQNGYFGCYYTSISFFAGYIQDLIMTYTVTPFARTNYNGYSQMPYPLNKKDILRCNFEGTNGSTTFNDAFYHSFTTSGSPAISTADKKFGTSSILFSGSSDYISPSTLSSFAFYENDFVIEMWLKTTETTGVEQVIYKQVDYDSIRQILIKFGGVSEGHKLMVNVGDPKSDWAITSLTKTDFSSSFRHLQVQKKNFGFTVFVDGISVGHSIIDTGQSLSRINDAALLHFNGSDNSTTITDSSFYARSYTATNALLKTAEKKFGTASCYFDGDGDYITAPATLATDLAAGPATIECWIKVSSNPVIPTGNTVAYLYPIVSQDINSGGGDQFFGLTLTNNLAFSRGTAFSPSYAVVSNSVIPTNTWTHVAVSFDGNYIRLFINGILDNWIANTTFWTNPSTTLYIGYAIVPAAPSYKGVFNGYIDELRISKVARYINSFTVPSNEYKDSLDYYFLSIPSSIKIGGDGTNGFKGYMDDLRIYQGDTNNRSLALPVEPFPSVSSDVIDSSPGAMMSNNRGVILTNEILNGTGTTVLNRSVAFFNGTGSLTIKKGPDEWFPNEDWTLEFWMNRLDTNVGRDMITSRDGAQDKTTFLCFANGSSQFQFYFSKDGINWTTLTTSTQSANTWYHIAVVRYKEVITLYMNGIFVASDTIGASTPMRMASWGSSYFNIGGGTNYFYGYLKDFQFIRGYAKYITQFNPSTDPLSQFYIDYYRASIKTLNSSVISHYTLGDTSSSFVDIDGGWNLNLVNPGSIILDDDPLATLNADIDGSATFSGGYGSGQSFSVSGKSNIAFNFFIKTTETTGTIIEKSGSYKIEMILGKIRASFYMYGGSTYTADSLSEVNDGITHEVTVNLMYDLVEILIDGVLDSNDKLNLIVQDYKYSELKFDGSSNATLLQMRCNNLKDDANNSVLLFGNSEYILYNDSPFATKSLLFDGSYHLEIPKFNLSRQQSSASTYYPSVIDFTIEFWIKTLSNNIANAPIICFGAPGSSTGTAAARAGLSITLQSNYIYITAGNLSSGGASAYYSKKGSVAIPYNDWTHVAITCKNHNVKLYQDGQEQILAFTNFGSYPMNSLINCVVYTTDNLNIGGYNWQSGALGSGASTSSRANLIALDDIRITKGVIYG